MIVYIYSPGGDEVPIKDSLAVSNGTVSNFVLHFLPKIAKVYITSVVICTRTGNMVSYPYTTTSSVSFPYSLKTSTHDASG